MSRDLRGPSVLAVEEHGILDIPVEDLILDGRPSIDPQVEAKGFFALRIDGGVVKLQARGWIGMIPINERLAIDVGPRVPIANLARMLRIAGFDSRTLEDHAREYDENSTELPSLRDFYTQALLAETRYIEAMGLLRSYERQEGLTSRPRGRLLLGAKESRLASMGRSSTVKATWYERTADTPENRCIKLALFMLARGYGATRSPTGRQRSLARRLNAAYARLEDARLDARATFLNDDVVSGARPLPDTRSYYRGALDIAGAVIRRSGLALDRPGASLRMPSMLVNLEAVFEEYVRAVLRSHARRDGAGIIVRDGNADGKKLLFDAKPSSEATPDIVVVHPNGHPAVVLEVKYKPAKNAPDRVDLNQVIAYAASYRVNNVVVVQPKGKAGMSPGLAKLGDLGDLTVHQHVVDLGAADLSREEERFGSQILGLALNSENASYDASFSTS